MEAIRPDLGARNPCVLAAVAAARAFFLGGHLAAGLLHAVGEDVWGHILAHAAAEPADVDAVVEALPIFAAVRRTNPVWKQLCRRRWRTKWGFERRWRAALAEERELCLQRQDMDTRKGAMAAGTGSADAAAAANATWWYERYLWQEEDAKRSAMTVDELTDCAWDTRWYFEPRIRNPDHMRDVLMSGLGRSRSKPFRFVMRPHPDDWADRLPLGVAKEQALGAGSAMNIEDGRCVEMHWCLMKNIEDDPQPQVFAIYILREIGAQPLSVIQHVRRLDTWGWEIRSTRSVSRAIDLSFMAMDGDGVGEEVVARASAQLEALWSDYLGNMITEEKPVWIKQGSSSRHEFANYREIPDDDDLKAFLPW